MKQLKNKPLSKTIRHAWQSTGFNKWYCSKCGIEKVRENGMTYFVKFWKSITDPGCVLMNEKKFKYDKSHILL
jgi:hypothetical protein